MTKRRIILVVAVVLALQAFVATAYQPPPVTLEGEIVDRADEIGDDDQLSITVQITASNREELVGSTREIYIRDADTSVFTEIEVDDYDVSATISAEGFADWDGIPQENLEDAVLIMWLQKTKVFANLESIPDRNPELDWAILEGANSKYLSRTPGGDFDMPGITWETRHISPCEQTDSEHPVAVPAYGSEDAGNIYAGWLFKPVIEQVHLHGMAASGPSGSTIAFVGVSASSIRMVELADFRLQAEGWKLDGRCPNEHVTQFFISEILPINAVLADIPEELWDGVVVENQESAYDPPSLNFSNEEDILIRREEPATTQVGGDPKIEDDQPLIDAKSLALILFWVVGVIGVEWFILSRRKKMKSKDK